MTVQRALATGAEPHEVEADALALAEFFRDHSCALVTGAGCSTESGIPDYRGTGRSRRRAPIQAREFLRSPEARRRYWARSAAGWPRFRAAAPSAPHRAIAALESTGHIAGIITQNVDRLHHAAGSRTVVELHGAIADVVCLACGATESRDAVQSRLCALNPEFDPSRAEVAPDGDAELPPELVRAFRVPACAVCAGVLKPKVVFFGENVPSTTTAAAYALADRAAAITVVGSSLAVFSGFRFARRARAAGKPIAIVNRGPTRADDLADLRIDAPAGAVLSRAAALLGAM